MDEATLAGDRCGYAITDSGGEQQPCDRPATGWRWYQDCDHEDTLDVACDWHANKGGQRIADAEAEVRRLSAALADLRAKYDERLHQNAEALRATYNIGDDVPAEWRAGAEWMAEQVRRALAAAPSGEPS